MSKQKCVYLIRHGQTEMNSEKKAICGSTDLNLSDTGIAQAKNIALNPLWKNIESVYVTPLKRTAETADILFPSTLPRIIVPEFAELNFGDYEGRIIANIDEKDIIFNKWKNAPETLTFPNGENVLDHAITSYKKLCEIAISSPFENIAIISHATTIRLILSQILVGDIHVFRQISCPNLSVSKLTFKDNAFIIQDINIAMK